MSAESTYQTLKEALHDWTDIDYAQHSLLLSIGMVKQSSTMQDYKAIYWTNNPFGDFAAKMLDDLVEIGCLLKRDEPDFQYKWNPEFQDVREYQSLDTPTKN